MGDLRSELEQLTKQFVASMLSAMQSASLSDLIGEVAGRPSAQAAGALPGRRRGRPAAVAGVAMARPERPSGRRRRATPEEVQRQKDAAFAAARALKPGFSKGDVMKKSGSRVDLGRALTLLVAEGKLTKKGDRRMTRYWVK